MARRARTGRRWAHLGFLAFALAVLGTALAWSGTAPLAPLGVAPQRVSAAANDAFAPAAPATDSPTSSATATETPTTAPTATTAPVTFSLVSPSAGSGPVGAQLTLSGAHWGHGDVALGAATASASCGSPGSWVASFPSASPSGGSGSFTQSFIWPVSLNSTSAPYFICAMSSAGTASVTYQVDSTAPPVISLSSGSVQVGAQVTINGSNFFTSQPIFINLQSASGTTRSLGTATAGPDGTFSYQYSAVPLDVGALTVIAVTQQEGQAPPAIQATANLNVLAAASPTVTASRTPATATAQAGAIPGTTQQTGGTSGAVIVGLIALMALVLAMLVGVFIFLMLRRRDDEPAPSGNGWQGANGAAGYGATWGQPYPNPNLPFPDEATLPQTGSVGQWGNDLDGPGPDWHGRSLSTRPRMPAVDTSERLTEQRPAGGPSSFDSPAAPDPWGTPARPGQQMPPSGPYPGQLQGGAPMVPGTGQPGARGGPPQWQSAGGQPGNPWGPSGSPAGQGAGTGMPGAPNAQPYPPTGQPNTPPSSQPSGPTDPWSQDGGQGTDQDPWRNNDPWGNSPGGQGRW